MKLPASSFIIMAILLAPLGIVWHELVGHGLMGLLCGGRITRVQCLGVQFVGRMEWTGLGEGLGAIDVADIPTRTGEDLTLLAGAVSTLLAAAAALVVLRRWRVRGARRVALTCLGLWSLDIVTFTLPSLGLRRYVWFGTTYSEPYDAALALGVPGPLFQVLAIGGGLLVLAWFFLPLRRAPQSPAPPTRAAWWRARLMRSAILLLLLALVPAIGWYARTVPAQPALLNLQTNWVRDPAARVRDWQEDIDQLVQDLSKRHRNAFFACRRQDFEAAAAALRHAVAQMSDEEVVVGLMKLVTMIGDAHTAIDVGSLKPAFHRFALALYVFSDGPVIFAAREAQKDLIGCRLVKFSGVNADEAFRLVASTSACENEPTLLDKGALLLVVPEIAHAIGLTPTTGEVTIVVRDGQGRVRSVELTPLQPGEKLAFATVDESRLPLSRQRHQHQNWFELLPEQQTLYLRYNTCADEPDQSVEWLTNRMLEAIDANQVNRVIVDLRGNSGGDSGLLEPFIAGLKHRTTVNHPGGIIVLIGRHTFSSAHMHATYLKRKLGATLVGEPTGQKPNAYGEVRMFVLQHSQIIVRYSTKYWRTEPGDALSLEPDILVRASSADYFSPRDPVLEAALGLPSQ